MKHLCFLLLFLPVPALLFSQQKNSAPAKAPLSAATAAAIQTAEPKTPAEFFARARQLSDLIAAGIPFHLKATYVATGDTEFTGNGTYEEWWESKDLWRKEATLGDYKYVLIKNGGKFARYDTSAYIPLRLRQVFQSLPIPFPSLRVASSYWERQHQKIEKVDLTVLIQEAPPGGNRTTASARDPRYDQRYYFDAGGLMRIRTKDATVTIYNEFQTFQNLAVPRRIEVSAGSAPFLTITVDLLEPLGTDAKVVSKLMEVPSDLQLIPPQPHVTRGLTNGVTPSRLIHSPHPVYPPVAKQQRIQGTVVLEATIDENGAVREPHVVRSAGSLLDTAAIQAVRKWRYLPTTFNGVPVAVNTTISVIFSLKQ